MTDDIDKRKYPTWRPILRALNQNWALIVLIVLVILLSLAAPAFRRPTSLLLIGLEASFIGIVAVGQTLVILTSGIDLSVEANVAFSGVLAAILISGSAQSGGQLRQWHSLLYGDPAGNFRGHACRGAARCHHHRIEYQSLYRDARIFEHSHRNVADDHARFAH